MAVQDVAATSSPAVALSRVWFQRVRYDSWPTTSMDRTFPRACRALSMKIKACAGSPVDRRRKGEQACDLSVKQ